MEYTKRTTVRSRTREYKWRKGTGGQQEKMGRQNMRKIRGVKQ